MKRDWEIVRRVLLGLEQLGDSRSALSPEDLPPYDSDLVSYHFQILGEAGLIEAKCGHDNTGTHCWVNSADVGWRRISGQHPRQHSLEPSQVDGTRKRIVAVV